MDCWAPPVGRAVELPSAYRPIGWQGRVESHQLWLTTATPQRVLSSAPAGGGLGVARSWLNAHVRHDAPLDPGGPAAVLARRATACDLPGPIVGMMTGATMASTRIACAAIDDIRLAIVLTAGLSNARAAGDRAEQRRIDTDSMAPGTINMALFVGVALTDAALVETTTVLTEAKTATLAQCGIVSPVSGRPVTGTGTDATAVFCGQTGPTIAYTGKHTIIGETVARLVMTALADSVASGREPIDAG